MDWNLALPMNNDLELQLRAIQAYYEDELGVELEFSQIIWSCVQKRTEELKLDWK